jgi:hypothetical protein
MESICTFLAVVLIFLAATWNPKINVMTEDPLVNAFVIPFIVISLVSAAFELLSHL